MPLRYDRMQIKGQVKKTDEGYILASAPIAREGVYTYRLGDGTTRKELVDGETLSNIEANDSLKLKPVTNNHPREKTVNSGNSKFRSVGSVGESINHDEGFLMANFSITDSATVNDINKGRKQLSPGYKVDLVMTPGTFNGEHYDAIQRNRRYNHLAIVDNARGGDQLRLNIDHADAEDAIVEDISNNNNNEESRSMDQVTYNIDGLPYDTAPQVVNHISKLESKIDTLNGDLKTANDNVSKAEAKSDAAEEKVKELEKHDSQDEIQAAVKARISLEKNASKVLKEDNFDGITDEDLMKKVIIKKSPKAKLDGKDAVYVEARYDSIVESLSDDAFNEQKKKVIGTSKTNNDGDNLDSVSAHAAMTVRNRDLWKQGREEYA